MSVNNVVVILFIYLFAILNSAMGVQYQWNGSVDTYWNNSGNWSPNSLPGVDDTALFNSTSSNCELNVDISIKSIIFSSGYSGQFTLGNRRVTVSGDIDFSSGGSFFITSFDTLIFNSSSVQRIVGKPGIYLPFIIKDGTGTLEVHTVGFKTMGLSLKNGILSNSNALNDTVNGDLRCTGGQISLNNGSMVIVGNADFGGLQAFSDTTGTIYFNGVVDQYVKSNPLVHLPLVVKNSSYNLVIGHNHFRARYLKIMYGQVRMDTTFNIDSIYLFPGSVMMSDTASNGHDTIMYLSGNGNFNVVNSELCFNGPTVDLSSASLSFAGLNSALAFIGSNQTFIPSTYSMYHKIRRKGTGVTTITMNGLRVDTLELISGEFNLGNGLSDSISGAIRMMGGTLNFSSSTVRTGTNINLNGPGTIVPGSGRLEFNGYMDRTFVPRSDGNNPAVGMYSMTTRVAGNHLRVKRCDVYNGILEMDTSFRIDTLYIGSGAYLRCDSAFGNSDTVSNISGNGNLELRNSELCFNGNQVDLDSIGSINGGSLAFIGTNQTFTPSTYFMYNKIRRKGTGVTTITTNGLRVDTLELISGEFNLGNGLTDSLGSAIKMMGGTLNFENSMLRTGSSYLTLNGAGIIIPSNGGIEFISMGTQNFVPPVTSSVPALHSSSDQLHIIQNRLRTSKLQINSGAVILDTTISADTLNVNSGAALMFDTVGNQKDTIGNINGSGSLMFGKTTIHIKGDANFSYFNSFSGNADLEFGATENRLFVPNSNLIFNKIKKVGNNTLTIDAHGLRANTLAVLEGTLSWGSTYNDTIFDTLHVKNATVNLGNNPVAFRSLIDSNGIINFNYGSLVRFGGSGVINLAAAAGLSWNYGGINFEGNSGATVILIPSTTFRLPPIHINGNDTIRVNGNFKGTTIFQNNGGWDWGNNFSHTIRSASVNNGMVAFGSSTVAIDSGSLMLESATDVRSGTATILFNATNGIQSLASPSSSSLILPQILKNDTSTLQIVNQNVRCREFKQTAGTIQFSGFGIIADSSIIFENVDSLLDLDGVTLQAGDSIRLSGTSGNMIHCTAASQWYISVPGNLVAENAIIGNCIVTGTSGIVYPPYIDAGGNSNWIFWVDTFPPDNDLVLNLQTLDTGRVRIWWNPSSIDSTDAETVGISYSSSKMPDSIDDPAAIFLGTYSVHDSIDTVLNLNAHTDYYFAAAVSDISGNWSDFTTNSKNSIRTKAIAPYNVSAPDTIHKQSFMLSWVNPPGLASMDSVFIHTALLGNSWNLYSKMSSSQTAAAIVLPASEGQYQYMISTSQDSAGVYYADDAFIGNVTYTVSPPVINIPKDTFNYYFPNITWQAPAGFGSSDSFFVFSDTITGNNTWVLNGQYASNVLSHALTFNDYGLYKVMVSTSWDKYGTIDQGNVTIDTLVVIPSSKIFTWDISSDSGYQSSNGIWGSDRFWSNDGKTLTGWLGAENTACFNAVTVNTVVGINGTQYADSIVFNASGYKLSGGTLVLSTGVARGMAVDTIHSTLSSALVSKTGIGEIVVTGKTHCDSLNVFDGLLTIHRSDSDTVIIPGVLSVYTRLDGFGRLAKKVITYNNSSLTPGSGTARKISIDNLSMSPTCSLNIDIGNQYDTISVKNTAIVNGFLNISSLNGFGKGAYPVITCAGTMIDSGIKISRMPYSTYTYELRKEDGTLMLYIDTLFIDTIQPKIKINITSGSFFQKMPTAISGNASDSISGLLSISLLINKSNDSTYWNGSGWQKVIHWIQVLPGYQWNYAISGLSSSEGTYIIKAGATDSAGNMAYDTTNFIIDTSSPQVTKMFDNLDTIGSWSGLITGEVVDSLSLTSQVKISVKNDSGMYYNGMTWMPGEVYLSCIGTKQWSFRIERNSLREGIYTVAAIASDTVGNMSLAPYSKVYRFFLKKDTTLPIVAYIAHLRSVAVNCSTINYVWNSQIPAMNDSIQLVMSLSGYPESVNQGEYQFFRSRTDSSLTVSNMPGTGVTVYSRLFLKEKAGDYTLIPDSATTITYLGDCVAPKNLVQIASINTEDSLTTIKLKAGNTDSVQILFGIGESKETSIQNVKQFPNRDTAFILRTVIPGMLYCAYTVSDPAGNRASFNYDSMEIRNTPPQLQAIADTIISERNILERTIQAFDINNDSLSYGLLLPRSGMNVTGTVFKWLPVSADIGSHSVIIECRDKRGAVTYDTFNIIVKDIPESPEILYAGKFEVFEDSSYEGKINVTDPDNADTLKVSVGKLPAWMKLSENKLTGTPKNEDVGIHLVELRCTDKSLLSDTIAFQVRVINTNDKPTLIFSSLQDTITEKQKYTFEIKINESDENDSINVKSVISKPWLKINSVKKMDNGMDWVAQITCTPVQVDTGLHEIKIEIADKASSVVYLSKKIQILDSDDPPAKPVVIKRIVSGAVQINVSATDDRDAQLLYSIKMRDLKNDSSIFKDSSVRMSNVVYPLSDGRYELRVIAIDGGGLKSVETIDTCLVTGASEYVFKDTGWSMVSIPSKVYSISNLKNTKYLLNWDESGVEKQVYSYYHTKEELTDLEYAKAYWRKGNVNDTIRISNSSFEKGSVTVNMHKTVSGWNQISSPYPYPVTWPRKGDVVWRWNSKINDYEEVQNVLEPWVGYWVRVDTAVTVTLTPVPFFSTGTLAKMRKCYFQSMDNWTMQVSIRTDGGRDVDNKFGFNQNAMDRFDELDRPEPPAFEGRPVLYFNRDDWKTSCKEFASDIRKNWKSVNIFEFALSGSKENENGVLSFDGLGNTSNLYVFTKNGDSLIQVGDDANYSVPLSTSATYQTVFVTDNPKFLSTFPLHFKMGNPYPNPFCPTTRINYTLPYRWSNNGKINLDPYTVTIDIYDILGRKLRCLVYRKMTPGNYSVMWNGKSENGRIVASGKYYCVLKADELKQIRNLTLIK